VLCVRIWLASVGCGYHSPPFLTSIYCTPPTTLRHTKKHVGGDGLEGELVDELGCGWLFCVGLLIWWVWLFLGVRV